MAQRIVAETAKPMMPASLLVLSVPHVSLSGREIVRRDNRVLGAKVVSVEEAITSPDPACFSRLIVKPRLQRTISGPKHLRRLIRSMLARVWLSNPKPRRWTKWGRCFTLPKDGKSVMAQAYVLGRAQR